jgi:hypothetical protein
MKKKKKKFGHRTYSLSSTSFSLKMASRNKLLPVWGMHVLGYTRGWERGTFFFAMGKKFPILSANPTCVFSLEISLRTISPENTRSYQPGKTETKVKLEAPRSLYSSPGYNNNINQ